MTTAQENVATSLSFQPEQWQITGRGDVSFHENSVQIKDCLISTKSQSWQDHEIRFQARSAVDAEQVQIWSGFHFSDRETRYALGLRGGNSDDLYLCRYAPNGANKMLALASLDFHPAQGEWYQFRVVIWDGNIQIYLNAEEHPRIVVSDKQPLNTGAVVLGGGWIECEFKNLSIHNLSKTEFPRLKEMQPLSGELSREETEEKRKLQRSAYQAVIIPNISAGRSEVSLDGNWLFKPDHEITASDQPEHPSLSDNAWHILPVPAFWNPVRNWLHLQDSKFPHRGSGVSDNYREKELNRCKNYTFDYKKTTSGWYRHWLILPQELGNKRFKLYFEAVSKVTDVWVNGQHVDGHIGMFGDFEMDITTALKPGKNLIAVHVQVRKFERQADADKIVGRAVSVDITNDMLNSLPHGMFQGDEGGIWQPVTLRIVDPIYIDDVYAKVNMQGGDFEITIANNAPTDQTVDAQIEVVSTTDQSVLYRSPRRKIAVKASSTNKTTIASGNISPALWSPETPNLYTLKTVLYQNNQQLDARETTIGFRTFEVKGNKFYLNGNPYWLRGANHPPCGIAPNDKQLANTFMKQMHDDNQMITRSHGSPFTRAWMDAADRQGVGVSYEGSWPWLMIDKIPSRELLEIWREEMLSLVKKYRNHPSLLLWTVNNEMYFTMFNHNKPPEMRLEKWRFLSEVIKAIRNIDPLRPICGDSGYSRVQEDYQQLLAPHGIDDGDIDDRHIYPGWYNRDFFQFKDGEWAKRIYWSPGANPDRPFFSQETSTGYPNNDTGHPTRKYLFGHYVPQAWVGDWAYEDKDPRFFLKRHAFLTKELTEVIRRTSPETAGALLFANLCWYGNIFEAERLFPYPAAKEMHHALQPVLLSAELFGRHFYSNEVISPRICIVNNAVDGKDLLAATLRWEILHNDQVLTSGEVKTPVVPHYERHWFNANIKLPHSLPVAKSYCQLRLTLSRNDVDLSQNQYDILIASPSWAMGEKHPSSPQIGVFDLNGASLPALAKIGAEIISLKDLTAIRLQALDLLIVANLDTDGEVPYNWEDVRNIAANGTNVLLLHPGKHLQWLLPETIASLYERTGRVVNMRIPESPVFNDIAPLELSWWQADGRETPLACRRSFRLKHHNGIQQLATYLRPHVYLGNPAEQLPEMSGSPLLEINIGKGKIIASEMMLNASTKDPIAAKLLSNLISYLTNRNGEE